MRDHLLILALLCTTSLLAQELTLDSAQVAESQGCIQISKIDGDYFLGEQQLSRKEFKQVLQLNSPEAWNHYRQGEALWVTGWCLFAPGLAASQTALACLTLGIISQFWDNGETLQVGGILLGGGVALVAAGIPCLTVGRRKKNNAYKIYNEECLQKQSKLEVSLQTTQNGISLAFKF